MQPELEQDQCFAATQLRLPNQIGFENGIKTGLSFLDSFNGGGSGGIPFELILSEEINGTNVKCRLRHRCEYYSVQLVHESLSPRLRQDRVIVSSQLLYYSMGG